MIMLSADDRDSANDAAPVKCSSCRFWEPDEELGKRGDSGICRRYPPSIPSSEPLDSDFTDYPVWPRTMDYEWCGEHKPKGD